MNIGINDIDIPLLEADFKVAEVLAVPLMARSMNVAASIILLGAQSRFISYGMAHGDQGKLEAFRRSARHMKYGVTTGPHDVSYAMVGQTLPRNSDPNRQRPDWSILQYQEALGPALDSNESNAAEIMAGGAFLALQRTNLA